MTKYLLAVASVSVMWVVSACGGGGGSGTSGGQSSNLIAAPAPVTQARVVGMGIGGISYWDGSHAYVDIARHGSVHNTSWGAASFDANGNVNTDFILIMGAASSGGSSTLYAPGIYRIIFNGTASISQGGFGSISNVVYNIATNTTTADLTIATRTSGNAWLTFSNTQFNNSAATNTGVRNVRVYRPGYPTDGSVVYTSEYLTAMRQFSVLRTMDVTNTNSNSQDTWASRVRPSLFGGKGAWEHVVELANAVDRNVWINVPVNADDTYISNLANLLKYGSDGTIPYTSVQANPVYPPLRSNLKVYVEYGNEVWNPLFTASGMAKTLSDAALATSTHPINFDGVVTGDQWAALRRWVAYRSSIISLRFRAVYGDSAMMSTVRPILSSQVGNANNYLSEGLAWAHDFYSATNPVTTPTRLTVTTPRALWYGGGGAAYYDSSTDPADANPGTISAYFAGLPNASFATNVAKDSIITKGYGLKNVAYEGGPGPGGSSLGTITNSALAPIYNMDPRMRDSMIAAHAVWDANGGDELVYYVYSGQSSPWSFVDDAAPSSVSDTTSMKMQAINAINASNKTAPTLGTAVPASVYLRDGSSGVVDFQSGSTTWMLSGTVYRLRASDKEQLLVPVRAPVDAQTTVHLNIASSSGNAECTVYVNGVAAGSITMANTSSNTIRATQAVPITLNEGINVIRLYSSAGEAWVRDVVVN